MQGDAMNELFSAAETFVIRFGSLALLVIRKLNRLFSCAETFLIRMGSLILLAILIYKLIWHELP
jgi:hypothetical protein